MVEIGGWVQPGFEGVRAAFEKNFRERGEHGAAVCVYHRGKPVVDLWGGPTYSQSTLQLVFSSGKPAVVLPALLLVERGLVSLDEPVARYWPAFAANGKEKITLRWLLSHRAGVPLVTPPLTVEELFAWDPVIRALEQEVPQWEPGTDHGYHVLTFGFLIGQVIRCLTGVGGGQFFENEIARRFELDLWIGLPEAEEGRVTPLRQPLQAPPGSPPPPAPEPRALFERATTNPRLSVDDFNSRALRAAEFSAANGVASARGLARLYAAIIGLPNGRRILKPETMEAARRTESRGLDRVQARETHFGLGFQLDTPRAPLAGPGSFGHAGYSGSLGFGHPELQLGFGYTRDQMYLSDGQSDPRLDPLIEAVLASIGARRE